MTSYLWRLLALFHQLESVSLYVPRVSILVPNELLPGNSTPLMAERVALLTSE